MHTSYKHILEKTFTLWTITLDLFFNLLNIKVFLNVYFVGNYINRFALGLHDIYIEMAYNI